MGFSNFGAEVPYHYGVLVPEACQGLLQVRLVIQSVEWYVCFNDQGLLFIGYDFIDHHVQSVEVCQLYSPFLVLVPNDQAHFPQIPVRRRCAHQRSHYVVFQSAATISLVSDLGLCQYHQVKAADMYHPDDLHKPGSPAIADVEVQMDITWG